MSNIKKPTGLSITRTGRRKFKASWKKGDSYSAMQCAWGYQTPIRHLLVAGKIVSVSHTHSVKTFNDTVTLVWFGVRGKKNGKWSDWAEKSVRIYKPKTPDVSAEFVQTAKTTFTWNPVKDNHERPIIEAIVQTILVKDCPDGRDAIASLPEWSDENNMTEYIQGESGSITPVDGEGEDTGLLSGKSYTRIVRVKEVGIGGESEWGYAKHIYAAPYPATNIRGTVKKTEASLNCQMYWETPTDAGHPIDEDGVVPQYSIAKPAAGMTCPDDAGFEPLPPQGSTEGTEGKCFTIDTAIGIDKALFLRVTTQHDTDVVQSNAVLAGGDSVGALKLPAFTKAPAITASSVTVEATNESEVEDSFIVDYLERADGSLEILGLHDKPTKVYQVSGIENARVGIKAYVGEWNSVLNTVNNIQMESAMLWSAGNVPVAPSADDFDVEQSTVANTVLVSWKYSWDDADACEVSWSTEPDAWMSTEDPEYYVVLRGLENKLAIKGVDPGEPLYVRIRYMNGFDDDAILSPYSDIKSIIISTVPAIPTLTLEKQYYTKDEDITCSWVYITTDGTEQAHAQIAERIVTTVGGSTNISYDPILDVDTEQRAVLKNKWPVGTKHALAVAVANGSGNWSKFSEAVWVTIAEPVECHITEHTLEYDTVPVNPQTRTGSLVTLNGGDESDVTSLSVALEPVQAGTPFPSVQVALNVNRYGVKWDMANAQMTRTLDAEGVTTNLANFRHWGSVNANYNNPFDSIYPWSDRKLCNIDMDAYRSLQSGQSIKDCVTYWEGDAGFDYNDQYGVWVYTPEFWARSYIENGYRYFEIATNALTDYLYYEESICGRYLGVDVTLTVDGSSKHCNLPTLGMPMANVTMANMHTYAKNWGATINDIYSIDRVSTLYIVEMANMNLQNSIGSGVSSLYVQGLHPSVASTGNTVTLSGLTESQLSHVIPNAIVDLGTSKGGMEIKRTYITAVSTSGATTTVTLADNVTVDTSTFFSVHGLINIADSEIGSESGFIGTDTKANAYYRGQTFYANKFQYILGVYRQQNTGEIWIANKGESDNYDALNTSVHIDTGNALTQTSGYIKALGMADELSFAPFCTEVGGNATNPVGDYCYVPALSTGDTCLMLGGISLSGAYCGWCGYWHTAAGNSSWSVGSSPLLKTP